MKNTRRQSNDFSVLGLVLLFLAVFGTLSCGGNSSGVPVPSRNLDNSADAVAANSEQAKLQIGAFQELQGTDYLMAAVSSPGSREGISYSSGENRYTRNYLFVNVTDKSSHLLFSTNESLILSAENLTEVAQSKPANPPVQGSAPKSEARPDEKTGNLVKWICYRIVKDDTDKDKRLNANDLITIALSDASGLDYKELITDVRAILHETRRGDSLIFIYTANGKNQIAEINLPTKQLTSTKELQEIVPK
jgi:hypothetical protein